MFSIALCRLVLVIVRLMGVRAYPFVFAIKSVLDELFQISTIESFQQMNVISME